MAKSKTNKRKRRTIGATNSLTKNQGNIALLLLLVLVIGVIYGIQTDKFGGLATTTIITNTETINLLETPQKTPGTVCSLSLNPTTVFSGDEVTGTIHDGKNAFCEVFGNLDDRGWESIYEGMTDGNGLLSRSDTPDETGIWEIVAMCGVDTPDRCVTPQRTLTVLPPPTTTAPPTTTPAPTTAPPTLPPLPPVNSVLFVNSESASMLGGAEYEWDISPLWWELEPASEFVELGVRIMTDWDYTDAPMPECSIPGNTIRWEFHDSINLKFSRDDLNPTALGTPICGVTWTPGSPWRFKLRNNKPPGCDINFNWEVQTTVCGIFD